MNIRQYIQTFKEAGTVTEDPGGFIWQKKDPNIDTSKLNPALTAFISGLPKNLQSEVLVTDTYHSGAHSKNSRHYGNDAVDLRYSDNIYKWSLTPEGSNWRKQNNITLLQPDHGTAKHLHFSFGQGSENKDDVSGLYGDDHEHESDIAQWYSPTQAPGLPSMAGMDLTKTTDKPEKTEDPILNKIRQEQQEREQMLALVPQAKADIGYQTGGSLKNNKMKKYQIGGTPVASKYKDIDYIQQGVTNDKLGRGVYLHTSDGKREFVTENEFKNTVKKNIPYKNYIASAGNIGRHVPGTENKSYTPVGVPEKQEEQINSYNKPLFNIQKGVHNPKMGEGMYFQYKDPSSPGYKYENDRDFISNKAWSEGVQKNQNVQDFFRKKLQPSSGPSLTLPVNQVAQTSFKEGGSVDKQKWVKSKIELLVKEGRKPSQAVVMAYSMFKEMHSKK